MNDIQINHMLRILRPTFKGVYAKDDVLPVKNFPSSMIVNESDWGTGGTHWVAIYFDQYGNSEFFDSYGKVPIPGIMRYILKNTIGSFNMSHVQYQAYESDVCGHYCIYYLTKKAKGIGLNSMMKQFSIKDHKSNDNLVREWVRKSYFQGGWSRKI